MQMQTTIEYGPLQDFTFDWDNGSRTAEVATAMHAELDPDDPVKGSSTASSNAFTKLLRALKAHTDTGWVRGHLLNHDLGGLAVVNNLFPITSAANTAHYHEVEKNVKHWIGEGCHVEYNVEARQSQNAGSPDGLFICEAEVTEDPEDAGLDGERIEKVIVSHGDTTPTTDVRYADGSSEQTERHAGILYGANNTVFRDSYGDLSKSAAWKHRKGTKALNGQAIAAAAVPAIDTSNWDPNPVVKGPNDMVIEESKLHDDEYDGDFDDDAIAHF